MEFAVSSPFNFEKLPKKKKDSHPNETSLLLEVDSGLANGIIEEECLHDTHFNGICVECLKDISYVVSLNSYVSHCHPLLYVSRREASRIDSEITQKLLDNEKLALVLDLDNTLLHTITEDSVAELPKKFLDENTEGQDIIEIFPTPDSKKHYVKLRPGLFEFLEEAQKRFELYICTMGTKAYATSVARILDPTSTLFTFDKVISREDCPGSTKNLQLIFPCDNSMVLILDDREDVWTNANNEVSPNLLRIEPYQFFSAQKQKKRLLFGENWQSSKIHS